MPETHRPAPQRPFPPEGREPALNLPRVIVALALAMGAIHVVDAVFLSEQVQLEVLLTFAFLPARYLPGAAAELPGGYLANAWTFVTYAFLHGGWSHLFVNLLWMAVFGSAVARRFGALRFLLFSAVCAIAGAAAYLSAHFGEIAPMIGASAAISGHMAAATRFVFQMGGPLGAFRRSDQAAYRVPAIGFVAALSNPQVLIFLAVWFGINLVFGLFTPAIAGEGAQIAWEAHLGGFLAGFLLFSLFDPVRRLAR
jgi:membrane associated rhomboid family serine protease